VSRSLRENVAIVKRRQRHAEEPSERAIQTRIAHIYASVGCKVYWFSQARPTGQTPGPSDLYLVHRRAGAWWHEVKTEAGLREALAIRKKPKPTHVAQREFRELHAAIAIDCPRRPVVVLGGAAAAWAYLEAVGLVPKGYAPQPPLFRGFMPV